MNIPDLLRVSSCRDCQPSFVDAACRSASGTARSSRCRAPALRSDNSSRAASRTIGAHRRHVVGLEPTAERVGQQLLGHRADEHVGPLQQRLAQRRRRRRRACRRPARPTRRCASPPSSVAPRARRRRSSRARGRAGPSRWWQLAHAGLARCCSIRCAHRLRRVVGVSSAAPARRPAAAAAACRSGCRESTCRARPATCGRRARSPAGCRPCRAARAARSSVSGTRRKCAAVDVRDAVVPRQPLVDERVVGRQQVEHAAVLAR